MGVQSSKSHDLSKISRSRGGNLFPYKSEEQLAGALGHGVLKSSKPILGIDFTKSNELTGARSCGGKSLHDIGHILNPYEEALYTLGSVFPTFDNDIIACYGFGDSTTLDSDVFSFKKDEELCKGFKEAQRGYRALVPHLHLCEPTSFAPIIEMAMTIVDQSGGQYHILIIITDGQLQATKVVFTPPSKFSKQEILTIRALEEASNYPLSIIFVGVGDGPWDTMYHLYEHISARVFPNFHFVNFTEIMSKDADIFQKKKEFHLSALVGIPSQFQAIMKLNLLGYLNSALSIDETRITTLPPECNASTSSSAPVLCSENQICPICLTEPKDMAFSCGHQTCGECGKHINLCPMCRKPIILRIKLY